MRVIGTAGHVDHGKSTLVAALTGTHPDRLKEEQAREMTIDLGFGWLALPNGEEVGIVDVPGHRDFVENMLSGIGGIDAALLVIAADEGVMPQTREHLAILDLLQIPAGIIVLSKTDLAPDAAWLDLLEAEIRTVLAGTVLHHAPCVRVSARTREGLDKLLETMELVLTQRPARPDLGRPRLPVDRVFSMPGFGTVVTGTLADGHLSRGDDVEILPSGLRGRVRGLQTHKKKTQTSQPGSRTAINVSGVEAAQILRGDVVAQPGQYRSTRRLDARFRLLGDVAAPLKHGSEVKFFTGASETIAALRLLGQDELAPGTGGWIQLELRAPVVAVRGDHYILRRPSPGETLGGGEIIDHQPKGRHKRFSEHVLRSLEALEHGSFADVLLQASLAVGPAPAREVVERSRLDTQNAASALKELMETGRMTALDDGEPTPQGEGLISASSQWHEITERAVRSVESYHDQHPLRLGMPREELKSRLKLAARVFGAVVRKSMHEGRLAETDGLISRPGHQLQFTGAQQSSVLHLLQKFERSPFAPPGSQACQTDVGEDVFNALLASGQLIAVSSDVVFRRGDYDSMVAEIHRTLEERSRISLAEVRDLFNTSRKYAQALLEHLDASGVTVRDGDYRRLRR